MATESSTLTVPRFNPLLRIKNSLSIVGLIGGEQAVYPLSRWWIVWRMLWLTSLPLFFLLTPAYFGSLNRAIALWAAALAYTGLYTALSSKYGYSARRQLFALDLIVCTALLIISNDHHLILFFIAFSQGLFFPGFLLRTWQACLLAAYLILIYVAAMRLQGTSMPHILAHEAPRCAVCYLICWGTIVVFGSFLLRRILFSNDIDKHLAEQRREYRRRLHDDLGNTLCGLHFKIRGLAAAGENELAQSWQFLNQGYNRAREVLGRLVSGLEEEIASDDVSDSLVLLKKELEADFSGQVKLSAPEPSLKLSPEIQRQILSIIREAAANSFKHAGVSRVDVGLKRKRQRLLLSISDSGRGFYHEENRSDAGHEGYGLRNMEERAQLLGGRLSISSNTAGTNVFLDMPIHRHSPTLNNLIRKFPQRDISLLIPFMKITKVFAFFLLVIHVLLLPAAVRYSVPLLVIGALFAVNSLIWILLLDRVSSILARYPRLMLMEFGFYAGVFYYALQNNVPPIFWCYIAIGLVVNVVFIKFVDLLLMLGILVTGVFLAYGMAPAGGMLQNPGDRWGDPLFLALLFVYLAFSACYLSYVIEGLVCNKDSEIDRALVREREKMSAQTHRQLHGLVEKLGAEISSLPERLRRGPITAETHQQLAMQSDKVKRRLRNIIVSLDAPETPILRMINRTSLPG